MSNIDDALKMLGWLMGRKVAGMMEPQEKIKWLSYNGNVFVEPPEWDEKEFPYALVHHVRVGFGLPEIYGFRCSDTPVVYKKEEGLFRYESNRVRFISAVLGTDSGPYNSTSFGEAEEVNNGLIQTVLWTNTDIYADDGTLYLAASEPIPASKPDNAQERHKEE